MSMPQLPYIAGQGSLLVVALICIYWIYILSTDGKK